MKATPYTITDDGQKVRAYTPEHPANVDAGENEWLEDPRHFQTISDARAAHPSPEFFEVLPGAPAVESKARRAARIAEAAEGGYSADRFKSWEGVAALLCRRGYSDREAVAIMVSKWTRWAGDGHAAAYGRIPAKALADFLDGQHEERDAVRLLTDETFGDSTGPDWR